MEKKVERWSSYVSPKIKILSVNENPLLEAISPGDPDDHDFGGAKGVIIDEPAQDLPTSGDEGQSYRYSIWSD